MSRHRKALLTIIPLLVLGAVAVHWATLPAKSSELREQGDPSDEDLDAQVRGSVYVLPLKSGSLRSLDEPQIQALPGMTDVQKRLMWERVQQGQRHLRK